MELSERTRVASSLDEEGSSSDVSWGREDSLEYASCSLRKIGSPWGDEEHRRVRRGPLLPELLHTRVRKVRRSSC